MGSVVQGLADRGRRRHGDRARHRPHPGRGAVACALRQRSVRHADGGDPAAAHALVRLYRRRAARHRRVRRDLRHHRERVRRRARRAAGICRSLPLVPRLGLVAPVRRDPAGFGALSARGVAARRRPRADRRGGGRILRRTSRHRFLYLVQYAHASATTKRSWRWPCSPSPACCSNSCLRKPRPGCCPGTGATRPAIERRSPRTGAAAGRARPLGDRPLGAALRLERRRAHRLRGSDGRDCVVGRLVPGLVHARGDPRGDRPRDACAKTFSQRRRTSAARRRLFSLRQVRLRARSRADESRASESGRVPPAGVAASRAVR